MQKGFAPLLILVTALVVIAAGATYYFGIKKPEDFRTKVSRQNPDFWSSLSPGPTNYPEYETKPIDTDETANWKTYTNTKFAFQVKYPPPPDGGENETKNSSDYSFLSLLSGCLKFYAVTSGFKKSEFVGSVSEELAQFGKEIPWEKLDELRNLKEGESKSYDTYDSNQKLIYKYTYKRLPTKNIGGFNNEFNKRLPTAFGKDWFTFAVTKDDVDYPSWNISYNQRNNKLYVIKKHVIAACEWSSEVPYPLHTFKFLE